MFGQSPHGQQPQYSTTGFASGSFRVAVRNACRPSGLEAVPTKLDPGMCPPR